SAAATGSFGPLGAGTAGDEAADTALDGPVELALPAGLTDAAVEAALATRLIGATELGTDGAGAVLRAPDPQAASAMVDDMRTHINSCETWRLYMGRGSSSIAGCDSHASTLSIRDINSLEAR
ncbi:MAG TPA: hypothetical protein VFS62_04795, partial [Chloroflexota bacterium]|nr:hypothetical protein [Chloroflexota bacterium]